MQNKRNISIDRYRGLIVFLMIFFQMLAHFENLGVLTHISVHAPNFLIDVPGNIQKALDGVYFLPNMTLADIIAPAFMFAIGLTVIPSYKRRVKTMGKKKAVRSLIERYLVLVGVGVMFNIINTLIGGGVFDKYDFFLDFSTFCLSALFLITFLASFIFKKKKSLKNFSLNVIRILGIYGILIMFVNMIVLIFINTDVNYGFWNTLQHIGLSCIITILIIASFKDDSSKKRLIASIILFVLYSIFHESSLNVDGIKNAIVIDQNTDGGILGSIGYASLLLAYTVLADIYYKNRNKFKKTIFIILIPVLILIIYVMYTFEAYDGTSRLFTAGTNEFLMINKGSISPSYLLVSLFISPFMFIIIDTFHKKKFKFEFFSIWGKSAILMYILEFFLVGGVTSLFGDNLIKNAPIPLAVFECLLLTLILTIIAYILDKKNKIIKV